MNDDGLYLSSPTPYVTDKLYVHENLISTVVSAFGMHGRGGPGGNVYVYRNVVDQRGPVHYVRPSPERPQGYVSLGGQTFFAHGRGIHMESFHLYHNTCLVPVSHGFGPFAGGMAAPPPAGARRRIFNNLYVYFNAKYFNRAGNGYPRFRSRVRDADMSLDGNLHWHATMGDQLPADFFKRLRTHALSERSKKQFPLGWATRSVSADPKFARFAMSRTSDNDYRIQKASPAVGAGMPLPPGYPDPFRPGKGARPDIGAFPLGAQPLRVGIRGRIVAGSVKGLGHFPKP